MKPKSYKGADAVAAARKRIQAKKKALLEGLRKFESHVEVRDAAQAAARRNMHVLRASMLRHDYGNPEEQKDKLVDEILSMFGDPHCWPMTDTQRIELLKHIYRGARKIRDTENAIKAAS